MPGLLLPILLSFSWLPAFSMTGVYEIIWRIFYYRRMHDLKYKFNDNLFSNVFILIAILASYLSYVMREIWLDGIFYFHL